MYKQNSFNNRGSRGGSHGGFRGGSRGGFRGGRPSRPVRTTVADVSCFINKAEPLTIDDYVSKYQFTDFGFEQRIVNNIIRKGYTTPMPIQDQAIPHIVAGKDLLGLANTGMGKTAAFLLPLIQKVIKDRKQKVLIITPTRELAEQIEQEFKMLASGMGLNSVLVIGGASMNRQIIMLRRDWNFIVGTPGRLTDLMERRSVDLKQINNLVLDEVDRMFDMGFSHDVNLLLGAIAPVEKRQSLFFSATLEPREESLVYSNSSRELVKVTVKVRDTAASVEQDIVRVTPAKAKIEVLHDILSQVDVTKTLIFARTKWNVEKLSVELKRRGFKADSIHGNKSQFQRQRVLDGFKQNRIAILVATDVAARGLDIPDVSHVINYELPESYDDYIHRIGRTGRANKNGKALTFVE